MKRLILILGLLVVGCTPAIIGVSVAFGGASVAVTYEVLKDNDNNICDGGK
jgi:hypothetical protein